jgi:shikimate 5-dehydrogenase
MYPADISTKNLSRLVKEIKNDKDFVGSAITMPYKEEILKYID